MGLFNSLNHDGNLYAALIHWSAGGLSWTSTLETLSTLLVDFAVHVHHCLLNIPNRADSIHPVRRFFITMAGIENRRSRIRGDMSRQDFHFK